MRPMLCALWNRIERDVPTGPTAQSAFKETQIDLACGK